MEYILTITPIFQRIPISLTLTAAQNAATPAKRRKPRRRIVLWRGSFMLRNGENLDFKRLSGIEKVHRNSIKITVDLWRSGWDSNPRAREGQRFSRPPRYDRFDTTPYKISSRRDRGGLEKWRRHPDLNWSNRGFAVPCLTTWLWRHMERATRFELATSTLARWRSAK